MMKANTEAIVIPWKADVKNARSDGIQAQYAAPDCTADFIALGAFSR